MRKEIARLNEVIEKGWISVTQSNDKKVDESKGPQFKQGRHPSIKRGLGHTKGAKTNGRRIVNGYECVQFERKGKISTDQPTQTVAVQRPRAAVPRPAKMGRLPILLLIKLSPRRRCTMRNMIFRSLRNQCGPPRISMPINQRLMHSTKLDIMLCFEEQRQWKSGCKICWKGNQHV